jgi:hypothetical protein
VTPPSLLPSWRPGRTRDPLVRFLAAGNSAGDREMLDWAMAGDGPGLALLVDHDDREREFAYQSVSGTLKEHEPMTAVATRLGWTVVSMANDWATVFSA